MDELKNILQLLLPERSLLEVQASRNTLNLKGLGRVAFLKINAHTTQ